MLARRLKIRLDGIEVGTTPMLVPAVSSRLNLRMNQLLETLTEIVNGPFLISSFDLFHSQKIPEISFPDLIFLDSGGYECNNYQDISEMGLSNPNTKGWNEEIHKNTIEKWNSQIPTAVISFDHPDIRQTIDKQAERALNLFRDKAGILREFLIKPETKKSFRVNIKEVENNAHLLSDFDIIGFAEKELGPSILERMVNITKIRMILKDNGLEKPIHLFGSLDPVNTPLYFISGADIFDGLSWLRFIYSNGEAMYTESVGPKTFGIHVNYHNIWISSVYRNFSYLQRMKLNMERFFTTKDFDIFEQNSQYLKKGHEDLLAKTEVD